MGYEVPENTLRLMFTDSSFEGLEVVCKLASIDQISSAAALASIDPKNPKEYARVEQIMTDFAAALVSWNCTRKGRKVPPTSRGVGSLDPVFVMQLVEAWLSGSGQLLKDQAAADAELEQTLTAAPLT